VRQEKVAVRVVQALLGIGIAVASFAFASTPPAQCHWHDGAYALAAQLRVAGVSRSDAHARVWEAVADEKADAAVSLVAGSDVVSEAERATDKAKMLDAIRARESARKAVDLLSDKILEDTYVEWAAKTPLEVVDAGYEQCLSLVACESEADPDGCMSKVLSDD